MSEFSGALNRVLADYGAAQQQELADHPLAKFISHEMADIVREIVGSNSYKVTGSPGRGNWAETPWVAVFDRLVTETAQRGFYVVYLFRRDGAGVHLSLNQGTTEVHDLYGDGYREELKARAQSFAGLLATSDTSGLVPGPVDLDGHGMLTTGYETGSIYARFYASNSVPEDPVLEEDLRRMVDLYGVLVEAQDRLAEDADPASVEVAVSAGTEAQNERWHKRTERNPKLTRDAKRVHGTTCKVCGFNFEERYGEIGVGYIEAHHLTPFASLQGRPTELDPVQDFTVVCPNCHRMLHKRTPPLTPEQLSALIMT